MRATATPYFEDVSDVPEELRPALAAVLSRLVAGDAEGLKRDGTDPHPESDLFLWVREYGAEGARLVTQPDVIWDHSCTNVIPLLDGSGWAVELPLWTEDESPSDLTLSVVVQRQASGLRVTIEDLHVL